MPDFPNLLSPLQIGQTTVRNRILVSAHVPGFADNNKPGKKYIAYHQTYARNGVGLQITGGTPVHRSGMLSTSSDGLWNLDESIIPGYQALSHAIHEEGGKILAQLAHSAGTVLINKIEHPSWSASAIRSETTGNISHAMTVGEIAEVIESFAKAAARAREGGLDGVEILAAFGFLPQAFLSPLTNFREDQYGGNLDNRMRFILELVSAVRSALGDDLILGIRIPGDEFETGGLDLGEMKQVAIALAQTGIVDYLNIIAHTNISHTGRSLHWPPTPSPHGLFIPLAAEIKKVVNIPVFGVGRVTAPQHAEELITRGKVDMIGMTRANICDPEIVKKITTGQLERIRPCVGANTCIANRYSGKPINCMHNATVSRPLFQNRKTKRPRRVTIIGAGPAGLECARVAAERGHQVTVYEATNKTGGQINQWASIASMNEFAAIINWRLSELKILSVDIHCNSLIDNEKLQKLDTDVIIFATGSTQNCRNFPDQNTIRMMSPSALLEHTEFTNSNALIINDGRGQAGLVAAEKLLLAGTSVEIITSDIAVANDLDPSVRNAWYSRLGKLGCVFNSALKLASSKRNQVTLENIYDNRVQTREDIDLIIDWSGSSANQLIKADGITTDNYSIGDCVTPRTLEIAIGEALAVAQKI